MNRPVFFVHITYTGGDARLERRFVEEISTKQLKDRPYSMEDGLFPASPARVEVLVVQRRFTCVIRSRDRADDLATWASRMIFANGHEGYAVVRDGAQTGRGQYHEHDWVEAEGAEPPFDHCPKCGQRRK